MSRNINTHHLFLSSELFHSSPFLAWRNHRFRNLYLAGIRQTCLFGQSFHSPEFSAIFNHFFQESDSIPIIMKILGPVGSAKESNHPPQPNSQTLFYWLHEGLCVLLNQKPIESYRPFFGVSTMVSTARTAYAFIAPIPKRTAPCWFTANL